MSKSKTVKKAVLFVGLLLLLTVAGYIIWWKLPVTVNRSSDIKLGHKVISMATLPTDNTEEKVVSLVEEQKIVKAQIKLIDSLSSGRRHISLVPTLDDTTKNIYRVRVAEDNGTNLVTYLNFLVDANNMRILNPTGKLEGQ